MGGDVVVQMITSEELFHCTMHMWGMYTIASVTIVATVTIVKTVIYGT